MHDWRIKPDAYDKYAFAIRRTWPTRIFNAIGLFSWLGVLYGYSIFFGLNSWYLLIFGPVMVVMAVYYALNYGVNIFFRGFDRKTHEALVKRYWKGRKELPTVDVFLPVCGESLGVLEWTFAAAAGINYPEKKIYVLDDKGDAETKRLAEKMGFSYLSRKDKGFMKKAGNLRFGHGRTDGEFVVIFDADFAPHPDFIIELLPYMADPKMAVVQSPQAFQTDAKVHGRSPLAYGAAHVQEDFYRVVQASRDAFGAAICVGSNAIYRRSALDAVGGTPEVEHSEDVLTGFRLISSSWKVKYVPVILAQGLCPENIQTYFQQQHRWCSGSLRLCLSREFLTSKATVMQKVCYFTGLLYYASHAMALLIAFQVYVVLLLHYDAITLQAAWPFVPHLIFMFVALPLSRRAGHRYGTSLARATQTFSCSHAVLSHFTGNGLDWHPTNSAKRKESSPFVALVVFNAAYFLLHAILVSVAIAQRKFPVFHLQYYSVMFWVLYNLVASFLFLLHGRRAMRATLRAETGGKGGPSATAMGLRYIAIFAALSVLAPAVGTAAAASRHVAERPATPFMATARAATAAAIAPAEATVAPIVVAHSEPNEPPPTYSYVAASGDSLTVQYRRAISEYLRDVDMTVDAARRVYAETVLTRRDGRNALSIGEVVSTDAGEIAPVIATSGELDERQHEAWAGYASQVRFD